MIFNENRMDFILFMDTKKAVFVKTAFNTFNDCWIMLQRKGLQKHSFCFHDPS